VEDTKDLNTNEQDLEPISFSLLESFSINFHKMLFSDEYTMLCEYQQINTRRMMRKGDLLKGLMNRLLKN
jgi:hypothetical protein